MIVFFAAEPLLLGRSDYFAIDNEGGSRIVIEGGNSQNLGHEELFSSGPHQRVLAEIQSMRAFVFYLARKNNLDLARTQNRALYQCVSVLHRQRSNRCISPNRFASSRPIYRVTKKAITAWGQFS